MGYDWNSRNHSPDTDALEDFYEHRGGQDWWNRVMKPTTIALAIVFLVVIFFILCWCCRRRKNRGLVLQPPQTVVSVPGVPAPYPQQAYHSPVPPQSQPYQGVSPYPVANTTGYPNSGAPYPTGGTTYPASGAPYPTGGAPYPTGGAPYPTGGAPYPTGGAPYPTGPGLDQPGFTVTAPPPSYNEAVGHEAYSKQAPYNPAYQHS